MRVAEHRDAVQPAWLDSNGHMNLAYYVVVFDRGSDAWIDLAGMGADHRAAGGTVFAVETHTLYRKELLLGAPMLVRSWLVAADAKRLHVVHEMTSDGAVAALQEVLFVHVSLESRRVVAMPADVQAQVQALLGEPVPDWVGRRIAVPGAAPVP